MVVGCRNGEAERIHGVEDWNAFGSYLAVYKEEHGVDASEPVARGKCLEIKLGKVLEVIVATAIATSAEDKGVNLLTDLEGKGQEGE